MNGGASAFYKSRYLSYALSLQALGELLLNAQNTQARGYIKWQKYREGYLRRHPLYIMCQATLIENKEMPGSWFGGDADAVMYDGNWFVGFTSQPDEDGYVLLDSDLYIIVSPEGDVLDYGKRPYLY